MFNSMWSPTSYWSIKYEGEEGIRGADFPLGSNIVDLE